MICMLCDYYLTSLLSISCGIFQRIKICHSNQIKCIYFLLIFAFWVLRKLPKTKSWRFFPFFSSMFYSSSFSFRSMSHSNDLFCVIWDRGQESFIFHINIHLFQLRLLKKNYHFLIELFQCLCQNTIDQYIDLAHWFFKNQILNFYLINFKN